MDHEAPPWLLRLCSCQLSILYTSKPLPGPGLSIVPSAFNTHPCPRGQPQRTSLSSPGCCAPALKAGSTLLCILPVLLECSLAKWTEVPQGSWPLKLFGVCSAAGPNSGPSRFGEEGGLLDSPLGGWTKRGQRGPRGLETKVQGRGLVGQAIGWGGVGIGLCTISKKKCF